MTTGENSLSLPPRLKASVKGHLEVSLFGISPGPEKVAINWWGQTNPKVFNIRGSQARVSFDVVTNEKYFVEYLGDAKKVFLEFLDGESQTFGYAVLDDLIPLVQDGQLRDLDVVNEKAEPVGNCRCQLKYTSLRSALADQTTQVLNHGTAASAASPSRPPPVFRPPSKSTSPALRHKATATATAKSKSKSSSLSSVSTAGSSTSRFTSSRPKAVAKKKSSNTNTSFQPPRSSQQRVTFSDENLVHEKEESSQSEEPTKKPTFTHHVYDSDLVGDFPNDAAGLRKILLRSKERLANSQPKVRPESSLDLTPSEEKVSSTLKKNEQASKEKMKRAKNKKTDEDRVDQTEQAAPNRGPSPNDPRGGLLPSWNLSTKRLHVIGQVTELVIQIQHVHLRKSVMDKITSRDFANPGSKKIVIRSKTSPATSFFISYAMPESESNQFCSRKINRSNEIAFNQRSVHPTVFKPELLDLWWTNDLHFRLHTRALNQRVPTLVGEASLGLKHLLIDPANSEGGKPLKLPLYTSQNFYKQAETLASEIVGDLYVSFTLSQDVKFSHKATACGRQEGISRPVSPQKAVR